MPQPAFFLYGSSPDSLAAQQAGYEQRFTNAAENNRAAAAAAQRTSLEAFLQAQAADDAARTAEARNRIGLFEVQRRSDENAANNAENQRRYNFATALALQDRADKKSFETRFGEPGAAADLELKRAQIENAKNENPTALKTLQFSHDLAEQDAQNGNIDSVAAALKLYPGITADQAQHYFQKSLNSRSEIESQVAQLRDAADTLTAYYKADKKLKEADAVVPSGDWYRPGTPALDAKNKAVAEQKAIVDQLQPKVDQIKNPKLGIMQQLQIDTDTGVYTPILPKLPWLKQSKTGTETTPSVLQPTPAAPTTTGTTPSFFQLATSNPAFAPTVMANSFFGGGGAPAPAAALPPVPAGPASFKTPAEVKLALRSGTITRDQAVQILKTQFPGFE